MGMREIKGIDFTARQITWILVSLLALILFIKIDFRRILDWSYFYYFFTAAVLITLLLFGGERMGARRWLSIGHLTFQPSEFAKLVLILTLALYLGNNRYLI
jgi:rod shape determining protein RodA